MSAPLDAGAVALGAPTRIAIIGDLHIGAPIAPLDALATLGHTPHPLDAAYCAAERLIAGVAAAQPAVVLLTGDVFDRSDASPRALQLAQRMFDDWSAAGIDVVVIGGNHDAESDLPAQLRLPARVHWLDHEHPQTCELAGHGIAVHGMSVGEADDLRDPLSAYPEPVPGLVNIAMLHTSLDGEWSNRACLPTPLAQLRADRRYDVWALGHVHQRLVLHESPLIVYPGSAHARKLAETGGHGFVLLELSPAVAGPSFSLSEIDTAPVRFELVPEAICAGLLALDEPSCDQACAQFSAHVTHWGELLAAPVAAQMAGPRGAHLPECVLWVAPAAVPERVASRLAALLPVGHRLV